MTISSIDIGTNTILLLVAEADSKTRSIKTLVNEYRIPRIGKGLLQGKPVSLEKITALYNVLSEYKKIAEEYNSEKIIITATNAFRIASNANEIIRAIEDDLGFEINVVSGKDEAELAFLGAVGEFNDGLTNMVIDIGGGSTEIITGIQGRITFSNSFQMGVVSGT